MDRAKFLNLLEEKCHLNLDQPVVAGVSGGPDSLCMLDLLHNTGINVIAIHLNHQLRPEADQESRMVSDFCERNAIKYVIGQQDISAYAKENKLSIEESARILRYQFLFEQAEEQHAQAVLVAHNADDQAETVLMHLLRGSGLSGLKGMQMRSLQPLWSDSIPLVRPLLATSREEILKYCREYHLSPSFDQSNNDTKYFRNRIRHDLLPELAGYNPQIKTHLIHMADVIGVDDDYLSVETENARKECVENQGERYMVFSRKKMLNLHPALLRRLLRQAIHEIDPTLRDIDFEVIDRTRRFLEADHQTNHVLLLADVEIIKDGRERIILCDQKNPLIELWPQIAVGTKMEVNLSGLTDLGGGWRIACEKSDTHKKFSRDGMTCVLDAAKIQTLLVDTFQEGDRFSPFNLNGKCIKLSDFWTKKGLPERARKNWPILRNPQGEIVWVPGYQISDVFKITSETTGSLNISLSRIEKTD